MRRLLSARLAGGRRVDAAPGEPADGDPPTDPYGFPPISPDAYRTPPERAVGLPNTVTRPADGPFARPSRTVVSHAASTSHPDPAEAAALAGAFAVDYLSWDEDDPGRRGRVLRDYLRPPAGDPALLGWSGEGRQRAEFALPGLVRQDGEGRVLVDVRVRVTPYRAAGDRRPDPAAPVEQDPGIAGVPAVAPAPTGRGWRSLASCWVRLSVPVALDGGRLLVDAWEETLAEDLTAPRVDARPGLRSAPAPDHLLVDDDPLDGCAP